MLQSVTIPDGIKHIKESTFESCSSIRQVFIPEGLEVIDQRAFSGCVNIEKIEIPVSLKAIYADAFSGVELNIYLKDLFAWCNVKTDNYGRSGWAGDKHFYLNNELIKKLVIPDGITSLSHNLFEGATDIEALSLPEGLKVIEWGCFQYCNNIKEVYVPTSIEKVETCAFNLNSSKTNVAFHTNDLFSFINSNMAVSIKGTTSKNMFNELYVKDELIKDLVIPEGIKTLGGDSNYNMYFFNHFNFTSVTLPKSLESIAGSVFNGCYNLKNIYCRGKFAATSLEKYDNQKGIWFVTSFNITNLYKDFQGIYVPEGRSNNYKSKWPINADYIFETPEVIKPTGNVSAASLTESVMCYQFVYDKIAPYIDLTNTAHDESLTADEIQQYANNGTIVFLSNAMEKVEGDNIVSQGSTPKLILRDSVDFVSPYDFVADEVIYQRKFKASGTEATTLCLPYNQSILPKGMKAYSLKGQDEQGILIFDEVESIEANKPYLITTTMTVNNLTGQNVQFKETPTEMPDAGNEDCMFIGTLSTISHEDAAADEAYILDKGMQWKSVYDASEDIYIPAGRAYLISFDATGLSFASALNTTSPIEFVQGDANCDGEMDVADIVSMVNSIQGHPSAGFNALAADMNGDGEVDIFDAMEAVIIVLNAENLANARRKTRAEAVIGQLWMNNINGKALLNVDEAPLFTAFQFDVEVADGVELLSARLPGCSDSHTLRIICRGKNLYRVVGVSMENKFLSATSEGLIELTLSNAGGLKIDNIKFVTPDERTKLFMMLQQNETTGVNSVFDKQDSQIYNLSGQKVEQDLIHLSKGVYIINKKKVVIK